jgi:hypothetical protein
VIDRHGDGEHRHDEPDDAAVAEIKLHRGTDPPLSEFRFMIALVEATPARTIRAGKRLQFVVTEIPASL